MKVLHNFTLLLHPRKLLLRVCYKIFQTFFPSAMQVHNPFIYNTIIQKAPKPFTRFVVKIWLESLKVICNLYFSPLNVNIHVSLQKHYCWLHGSMPSQSRHPRTPPWSYYLIDDTWLYEKLKNPESRNTFDSNSSNKRCILVLILLLLSLLFQNWVKPCIFLRNEIFFFFFYTITHQGYLSTSNHRALVTAMQTWGRRQKDRKNKGNSDFKERISNSKGDPKEPLGR